MKVTKFGHSCFLVEEAGVCFLMDPSAYVQIPELENIDAILITHDHADHFSVEALKRILITSPNALIITHGGVGKILEGEGISYTRIEDGEEIAVRGVRVASFGTEHAAMYKDMPMSQNTGFMIADRLYYPGDSFHVPSKEVEILALPVAAPWMRASEGIEFAETVMPRVAFPVHDAIIRAEFLGFVHGLPKSILEPKGIEFRTMIEGSIEEF
jgi:L-ascorbate metabolism protein UlaG (beta-lactamase superfamily)